MNVRPKIGVVGPCAAGKSTLVGVLRLQGFDIRHIAQEHSYVKDMWQRISRPDLLIYLDVSYPVSCIRRQMDWSEAEYQEQVNRLVHARQHAHLVVNTDALSIEEVRNLVLNFIMNKIGQSPLSGV